MTQPQDEASPAEDAAADEAALFASASGGDRQARNELIERYQHVSEYLARRFGGRGEPVEDLQQVAAIGLIKAVDGFDPDRGVQFSTYATSTIVGELKRHFRDKGWAVRVPRRLQEVGLRASRASTELWQELGRTPTIVEIAARTGLSNDDVLEGLDAIKAYSTTSLDAPPNDDPDGAPSDTMGEEDSSLVLLEEWASLAPAVATLSARDRRILYLRFFQDRTQSEIAQELGISQMHVSRLLSGALEVLRTAGDARQV